MMGYFCFFFFFFFSFEGGEILASLSVVCMVTYLISLEPKLIGFCGRWYVMQMNNLFLAVRNGCVG